jgi:hypothetical protein
LPEPDSASSLRRSMQSLNSIHLSGSSLQPAARARCRRRFACSFALRRAERSAVRGCRFCSLFMSPNSLKCCPRCCRPKL